MISIQPFWEKFPRQEFHLRVLPADTELAATVFATFPVLAAEPLPPDLVTVVIQGPVPPGPRQGHPGGDVPPLP